MEESANRAGIHKASFKLYIAHDQVAELIPHPDIDFVAFTGSVEGVRQCTKHGSTGIDVGLELGEKTLLMFEKMRNF